MLKILGRRTSANVQKLLWQLVEMGIPFEREDYGGEFGGNKSEDFLRLNPNGVVPTLIDGDAVIWESNTILRYVANRYGPTPLYPADAAARADCERWMDWQLGTLNLTMTPLYIALIRTPAEKRDMAALQRLEDKAEELFALLDRALADRDYLGGDTLTLGDIANGMFAYRWYELPVRRGAPKANLKRWYDRLTGRPGFQQHIMIGLS
ncbi:glutathione S-transferase family protein [Sphingobium chlorophenolicum]|uniref:Glutathione S-transferase domain protein n=1 Tax=Sphingobium chlorophenolicum TaxID=46429 RepID=A0A081RF84_SPHCR|nr:glutathione S-transferase family protein [Sphingobium chlorophenolicum]KEQ53857.1 Glutathione S-transferase domain protein [Sphingobium chlorophenolicum]